MKIGKLNKRVTLKTVTRSAVNNLGGVTETASTVKETWANVRPLSASENLNYGLELGQRTLEFTLRYDGVITQTNFLEYNSRTFRIKSVINSDEANKEYKIIASERTD